MLFFFKKCITSVVLPPGCFILIFIIFGVYLVLQRKRILGCLIVLSGVLLYVVSIPAFSDRYIAVVEWRSIDRAALSACDCMVVLGGGVIENVDDLSGSGILPRDSAGRTMDAARLYYVYKIPIITSGGSVEGSAVEADIAKRMLADLGVPQAKIFTEGSSHDTRENALFVKEMLVQKNFTKPILVTSAYHMRRALKEFSSAGITAVPFPSGMLGEIRPLHRNDFLPNANALRTSSLAFKEVIGRMVQ